MVCEWTALRVRKRPAAERVEGSVPPTLAWRGTGSGIIRQKPGEGYALSSAGVRLLQERNRFGKRMISGLIRFCKTNEADLGHRISRGWRKTWSAAGRFYGER